MQTALPWILFTLGVFYAAGGVVLVRRMAVDTFLDKALAALTMKTNKAEETATRILTAGAWLTLASGLTLMAQSRAALVVFAVNIALQAGYLIWAQRARPPEDELERRGRKATINAFFIYVGVFGLVILMEQQGLWRAWFGQGFSGLLSELVAVGLTTAALVWLIWNPPGRKRQTDDGGGDGHFPAYLDDDPAGEPGHDPLRVPVSLRLAPEYNCWPTWDEDHFSNVDPAILGFSDGLLQRLRDWDDLFQKTYNPDDPFESCFASVDEERLWADEAAAVWAGICEEWTGTAVNKISHVPYLTGNAFDGVGPYDIPAPDRVAAMAKGCGVIEIRDLLGRLDELAAARAETPDWDGDTQDDFARMQKFHAQVLARVATKYREDVEAGLASEQEETRQWVRLALDGQVG